VNRTRRPLCRLLSVTDDDLRVFPENHANERQLQGGAALDGKRGGDGKGKEKSCKAERNAKYLYLGEWARAAGRSRWPTRQLPEQQQRQSRQ
jgi:hypothetical protein